MPFFVPPFGPDPYSDYVYLGYMTFHYLFKVLNPSYMY